MKRIGVIGFGARLRGMVRQLDAFGRDIGVVAVVDPAETRIRRDFPDMVEHATFYPDNATMLDAADLDGVMIGTRCDLHTDLAVQVLERGLPLYLEKPVAMSEEQLRRLHAASLRNDPKVVVGFPLRTSTLCQQVKTLLDEDVIGSVENIQAINNVPFYGSNYYHGWMRDDSITGGLWLQKATHDLDYLTFLVGEVPRRLVAVESKTVFTGDMPAGLHCTDCELYTTCPESQYNLFTLQGILDDLHDPDTFWEGRWQCSFAVDTGNHDSATAILQYASGRHLTYTQNFYARREAARRGATLIGYRGTLAFDFYSGEITIHHHHSGRIERHDYTGRESKWSGRRGAGHAGAHFGGDMELAKDFLGLLFDEGVSRATLDDGILSAQLCLMARRSCETSAFQTFVPLDAGASRAAAIAG